MDATLQTHLCAEGASPDIAVLVGGLERGFLHWPRLWLSLQKNVLDVLAPSYELFLYLKMFEANTYDDAWLPLDPSSSRGDHDGQLLKLPRGPLSDVHTAIAALRPVSVEFENRSYSMLLEEKRQLTKLGYCAKSRSMEVQEHVLRRMLGHAGTLKRLWQLALQRETKRGQRYEAVMYFRPDLIHYLSCGPLCLYEPRRAVYHSVGADCAFTLFGDDPECWLVSGIDFWWLGPRDYAQYLGGAHQRLRSCLSAATSVEGLYVEALENAQALGLRVEKHSASYLGASVLRREGGLSRSGVQGIGRLELLNRTHQGLPQLAYGTRGR